MRIFLAGLAISTACLGTVQAAHAADAPVFNEPVPHVQGPKRTIAVGQIDVIGAYANASVTAVGGAVAAMLTTSLEESGQFIVVERGALPSLVTEQTLAKSGVAGGDAAPMPGGVLPASFLVVGSVTSITAPGGGNGGGLSFGGLNAFNIGHSSGDVTIDLRIVDTRTGGVVKAFSVKRKISSTTLGYSGQIRGLPVAANKFFNSPLGGTTRKALNDATVIIANTLGAMPWEGQVVEAENGTVYVNAGAEAGIAVGNRLTIKRLGRTFTDPATGAVLSQQFYEVGEVTITSVDAKIASGSFAGGAQPRRGDLIALAR